MNYSLYAVKAFILLDANGDRILSKYYATPEFPTSKEQRILEKQIYEKSKKTQSEVMMLDGNYLTVYKNNLDVYFYLLGPVEENEMILMSILTSFYDAVSIILKNQVEKRQILDQLESIVLALDETLDNGIVLETEPQVIAQKVAKRHGGDVEMSFNEQSIAQAFQNARNQFARSLLQ